MLMDRRRAVWEEGKALADSAAAQDRVFTAAEHTLYLFLAEKVADLDKAIAGGGAP
jgi:hypothetical protein